jgi:hypothetical protein
MKINIKGNGKVPTIRLTDKRDRTVKAARSKIFVACEETIYGD